MMHTHCDRNKVQNTASHKIGISWLDLLDKLKMRVEVLSPGAGHVCSPFLLGLLLCTSPDLYSMFLEKMPDLFTSH